MALKSKEKTWYMGVVPDLHPGLHMTILESSYCMYFFVVFLLKSYFVLIPRVFFHVIVDQSRPRVPSLDLIVQASTVQLSVLPLGRVPIRLRYRPT